MQITKTAVPCIYSETCVIRSPFGLIRQVAALEPTWLMWPKQKNPCLASLHRFSLHRLAVKKANRLYEGMMNTHKSNPRTENNY